MTGKVGGPEVAVVVHGDDLEASRLDEVPQLLRIEETVLRVVLDLLPPRYRPHARASKEPTRPIQRVHGDEGRPEFRRVHGAVDALAEAVALEVAASPDGRGPRGSQ